MRNILLTLSYDGTNFCGWQRQDHADGKKSVRTVQEEIEKALEKLHGTHIALHGSGRTDSGVHAAAQAANFFSPIDSIPEKNYVQAINALLPRDIRIHDSKEVPQSFDSRFSATSRVYRYFLCCGQNPLANQMPYVWYIKKIPDMQKLNDMASVLKGEIDCASFAAAGDQSLSTNRYIENARFFETEGFPSGRLLVFEIEANAFLWKMVRTLTGTFIEFERDGKNRDFFLQVLNSKDRKAAGVTAPPQGLFLWQIKFDGIRRHV